jgi:hypothetical protein
MQRLLLLTLVSLLSAICSGQVIVPGFQFPIDEKYHSNESVIKKFSAVAKDVNKVLINCAISDSSFIDFITIERSSNNKEYQVVSVIKVEPENRSFEWIDEVPERGQNQYRIRYSLVQGKQAFSKPVSVSITGDTFFKFYPNPVDNILIVRSEIPIEVQVADGSGKVRVPSNKVNGLQTINVSSLEKGVYLLRITNKLTNAISQEKLIKN